MDEIKASYQSLSSDLQKSELNVKSIEGVIACARKIIAKAQALIQDNERILALKKKRMEELEDTRG